MISSKTEGSSTASYSNFLRTRMFSVPALLLTMNKVHHSLRFSAFSYFYVTALQFVNVNDNVKRYT